MNFAFPFFRNHSHPAQRLADNAADTVGDIAARLQKDADSLRQFLFSAPDAWQAASGKLQQLGIRPEVAALAVGRAAMKQAGRHPSLLGSLLFAGAVAGIVYAVTRPQEQIHAPNVIRPK